VPGKTMNYMLARCWPATSTWGRSRRPLVRHRHHRVGGPAAVRRRAGGIHRRPSRDGNLAQDSFFPHRFGALSDRLTMQNGVLLMAAPRS